MTIVAHRAEMGTGSRTSLPMAVADELEADWSRVKVVQSPGDEKKYGNQNTDGSRSLRHFIQPMRECGAAARHMLETAAAQRWGVPVGEVQAQNHEVIHKPSGRKLGYGDLAAAASALPTPPADQIKLKDEAAFRYLGKGNVQIVDLFDITTGRAVYGIDTKLAGLKYAVIARPPVMGGKLASYDGSAAMKVPGVEKIVVIEGTPPPSKFQPIGGVAVIARNTWAAIKGREALVIKWDDGPHASYDSAAYKAQLEETARKPGKVVRDEGDAEKALGSAAKTVFAEYYAPHLAHAPMEPPCATARVAGGKCEVWAAVQSPGGTRNELVEKLGLKPEDVTVNVTLLGGGFGRKSKPDFVLEAALLSREMGGAPVKVTWTREDDLHHDYLHTVSAERIDAGLDAQGHVVAWRHRTVAPTIRATFVPDPKLEQPGELSQGVLDVPFNIANLRCEVGEAEAHTRIGWFRSVSNIPHAFAVQSFVAELAHAAGRDPKDMLIELLGPPRLVETARRIHQLRRPARDLPDRHGAAAARRRARRRQGGVGQEIAAAARPGHRRASQLPELCRHRRRGRGGRQGAAVGAARRHRDRLRLCRQPRAHLLADRRRGGDGAEPRPLWRDQLQERARRAEQLRRLPGRSASTSRRRSRMSGSSPTGSTCRRAASASRGCRPSRRPCATRSSPPPASASAACRSATSWRRSAGRVLSRPSRELRAAPQDEAAFEWRPETLAHR